MNIDQNLILVKREDKTEQIDFFQYRNGKWQVKYLNNTKVYQYNNENVIWLKDPKIIDHETNVIYENNQPITGIIKILDFGEYVKLVFKSGYKKVFKRTCILIEETCLNNQTANNTFEYLKTIANHVSIKLEEGISFLRKQYNTLIMISPRSALSSYLERKPINEKNKFEQAIFPFGFNISQKSATEKALTNQISVIEGPPGTGKTQTILNIIANAIINDKSVAVVSNNNSATANILEKLHKYNVDFIAAYLGNKDNKERFFTDQKNTYPEMNDWIITHSEFHEKKEGLKTAQKKLDEMLENQNKRAALKQEKTYLETEFEYFKKYLDDSNLKNIKLGSLLKFNADKILKILVEYKQNINKGKMTFREKVYNLFFRGIYNLKFYRYPPEIVITFLQKSYYEKKIHEIHLQIDSFSKMIENYNFEMELEKFSHESMELFKAKLAERYKSGYRPSFTSDALWKEKDFNSFIKEYPVILSTTHSLRNCAVKNYLFDYVIIDEASQVDVVTGALALSCAKNAVIVGDTKQLPNVVPVEMKKLADRIFESYKLDDPYNYANQSLLSSFLSLYENIPKTLLREHYRCHPKIIGFCNQKYYNDELIVLTNEHENDKPLVLYKTAKGNHARGKLNQRQIDIVIKEIIPEFNNKKQSVGVISPYRLQANSLKKEIGNQNIDVDTVHKFQGRERDVIILTTVAK